MDDGAVSSIGKPCPLQCKERPYFTILHGGYILQLMCFFLLEACRDTVAFVAAASFGDFEHRWTVGRSWKQEALFLGL